MEERSMERATRARCRRTVGVGGVITWIAVVCAMALLASSGCAPKAEKIDSPIIDRLEKGMESGTKTFDHSAYDELLGEHVRQREGLVDYAGLDEDEEKLDSYLESIASADLASLGREEQLALLINAYNAYTLKLIIENYPEIESIREIDAPWETARYTVGGFELSLDDIEHGIIRPVYKDPRIHFAVNCASIGCPPLRASAYEGADVDEQLDVATQDTLRDERYVRLEGDTLYLNKIFKWYGEDFIDDDFRNSAATVPRFVARYAREEVAELVEKEGGSPTVSFLEYDWSLNDVE
jgi:hypothetical protein